MAAGVFLTFAESSPRVLGLIAVTDVLEEGQALELSFGLSFQHFRAFPEPCSQLLGLP